MDSEPVPQPLPDVGPPPAPHGTGILDYGAVMSADDWQADIRTSYDTIAVGYADQVRDLLVRQPYLRAALALFADNVRAAGGGPVADVGCGPGYVTAHLNELGVEAFGIDLSPG